jgi:hypothetical protein
VTGTELNVLLQAPNIVGCIGVYMVGLRKRSGFVVGMTCEALWAAWGAASHTWGIYPWCAVWGAVYFVNWRRWKRPTVLERYLARTAPPEVPA